MGKTINICGKTFVDKGTKSFYLIHVAFECSGTEGFKVATCFSNENTYKSLKVGKTYDNLAFFYPSEEFSGYKLYLRKE